MSRNTAHARTNVTDATSSSDGVDHDHDQSSSEAKLALFVERRLESADDVDARARAVAATHRNRTNASSASPSARAIRARGFRPGDDIALATSTRALASSMATRHQLSELCFFHPHRRLRVGF
jgi:hypothetical protein